MGNKLSQNELVQHHIKLKKDLGSLLDPKYYDTIGEQTIIDWIPSMRERGQTLNEYLNSRYTKPDETRKKIYLLPMDLVGNFFEEQFYEKIALYINTFYQMDVILMDKIYLDPKAKNIRDVGGINQYLTKDILALMIPKVPVDAFCVMGLTSFDLYPEKRWNYVFGEATYYQRVGIFSMARLIDEHEINEIDENEVDELINVLAQRTRDYGKRLPEFRTLITRNIAKRILSTHDTPINRAMKIMTHEIIHMFGIDHCIYYNCLARGMMGVHELDQISFTLCPICIQKLYTAYPFDSKKRLTELLDFYEKNDIMTEVNRCRSILE